MMARIQEEVIVITVSKLHKTSSAVVDQVDADIVDVDTILALTSVAEELLGSGVVVEVNKA
jgi:hypothetical protein